MGKSDVETTGYLLGGNEILFALLPSQREYEVKTYCWDENVCGQIAFAGLIDEQLGAMCVCLEDPCPLEIGRLELGDCMSGPVWLRRLLPLAEAREKGIIPKA